jgi:hypothetical protein
MATTEQIRADIEKIKANPDLLAELKQSRIYSVFAALLFEIDRPQSSVVSKAERQERGEMLDSKTLLDNQWASFRTQFSRKYPNTITLSE